MTFFVDVCIFLASEAKTDKAAKAAAASSSETKVKGKLRNEKKKRKDTFFEGGRRKHEYDSVYMQSAAVEWIKSTDPSSGCAYYYNPATKESTWSRPTEYASPPSIPKDLQRPPPKAKAPSTSGGSKRMATPWGTSGKKWDVKGDGGVGSEASGRRESTAEVSPVKPYINTSGEPWLRREIVDEWLGDEGEQKKGKIKVREAEVVRDARR
jgi:hypothetical protein